MSARWKIVARYVGVVLLFPALRYVTTFAAGFWNVNPGVMVLVMAGCFVLAPVAVVLLSMPPDRRAPGLRIGGARLTQVVGVVVAMGLCTLPSGTSIYTDGLATALLVRTDLNRVQSWTEDAIDRYESGTLRQVAQDPMDPDFLTIPQSDLPPFLKSGVFAERVALVSVQRTFNGIPNDVGGPQVSVERTEDGQPCVFISWSFRWLQVGRPSFKLRGCDDFCRRVRPGVYAGCGGD